MKTRWKFLKIALLALPLSASSHFSLPAHAQTVRTVYLYNAALGTAPTNVNAAKSGPWGNGEVRNARDMDYEGAPVLRLLTRNFQEGARFDLTAPVDFESYRENGFLRLRLRFRDSGGAAGGAGENVAGGTPRGGFRNDQANPLLKPTWNGNAQFGGALPPFGGGPIGGENPEGGVAIPVVPAQTTAIGAILVTLLRENGATAGTVAVNLETSTPDENGWRLFVLPIKEMTSTPGAAGPIQRVIITSDQEDAFYMAQAAIVIENGQMTASIRRPSDAPGAQIAEIEIKPGALTLLADVEAGAADPAIEWNFDADNIGNLPPSALSVPAAAGIDPIPLPPGVEGGVAAVQTGPRLDARGLTATFQYPNEEQNYRVEVTVRDRSGQKTPVTTSILVRVRG